MGHEGELTDCPHCGRPTRTTGARWLALAGTLIAGLVGLVVAALPS